MYQRFGHIIEYTTVGPTHKLTRFGSLPKIPSGKQKIRLCEISLIGHDTRGDETTPANGRCVSLYFVWSTPQVNCAVAQRYLF